MFVSSNYISFEKLQAQAQALKERALRYKTLLLIATLLALSAAGVRADDTSFADMTSMVGSASTLFTAVKGVVIAVLTFFIAVKVVKMVKRA
jgi:riboflavin transporter FmnP